MTYTADRPVTVASTPMHQARTGLLTFDAEQDGHAFRALVHDPAVSAPLAAVLTQGDTLNVEGAFEVRRWVDLAGEWHDRPTLVVTAASSPCP